MSEKALRNNLAEKLAPFINETVVVKVGGEIVEDVTAVESLVLDIHKLVEFGIRVVLCHGGGPQISRELTRMNIAPKFSKGFRITDSTTLEVTCNVLLGEINRKLVAAFAKKSDLAVGISGLDTRMFLCKRKDESLGFVGDIVSVSSRFVRDIINQNRIPIVASIGIDTEGQCYNINADIAASAVAGALQAKRVVVVTNVDGIYRDFNDKSSLIPKLSLLEARSFLKTGNLSDGILPKLEALIYSLEHGVKEAQAVNGRIHNVVLRALTEQIGTILLP
jgi:acetylglutamate kinase